MSVLENIIESYNDLGKEVNGKEGIEKSRKLAKEAYNQMKSTLEKDTVRDEVNSSPKVFEVDIGSVAGGGVAAAGGLVAGVGVTAARGPEAGKAENILNTNTKVDKEPERDFASKSGIFPRIQLRQEDLSSMYRVEDKYVLNINPFQVNFSESELNQFTFQNPMMDQSQNNFTKESF